MVAGAVVVVVVGGAVVVVVVAAAVVVVVAAAVVVVVARAVVVVVPGTVVVVVPPPHASQQLDVDPTVADPPFGALQCAASFLMLHLVRPFASVRQHVTAFRRPQVERAAHATTSPRHSGRSPPLWTASFAACVTQLT